MWARTATHLAAAALLLPMLAGSGSDRVQLKRSSDGSELRLEIREGATIGEVLETCAPAIGPQLSYDHTAFRGRVLPVELVFPSEDLWDRIQPILTAARVVWVPAGEGEILLWDLGSAPGRGEISGRAPHVPTAELLDFAPRWANRTAMIITTVMPLRTIGARPTFSSLRQYFTDSRTEQLLPIDDANAILMTGPVPLVLSTARLLEELDTPSPRLERRFRVYSIEKGDAEVIAAQIEDFLTKLHPPRELPSQQPRDVVLALKERREVLLQAAPGTIHLVDELIEMLDR